MRSRSASGTGSTSTPTRKSEPRSPPPVSSCSRSRTSTRAVRQTTRRSLRPVSAVFLEPAPGAPPICARLLLPGPLPLDEPADRERLRRAGHVRRELAQHLLAYDRVLVDPEHVLQRLGALA